MGKSTGRTEPAAPEFRPFVPPEQSQRELTFRAIVVGSVLGIIFAASSVYLGLKVGLTVSASIPVAVLSITLFRWMGKAFGMRPATILENNIVQTTGSAGESIAAGIAFTMPSLLLMGFDMELSRILLVGLLGGLIGVLMMIPLRHGLIVKEHGKLTYPEGTACADVLMVGEKGGTSAKTVFLGFFVGLFYAFLNLTMQLWKDTADFATTFGNKLKGAMLSFEVSPPMLGVGYIIGIRTASNMMAGGVLAFLVLVPLIHLFGDSMATAMYPSTALIKDMSPMDIRSKYILYIGAGAVATGGFIALARALPTIVGAFRGGLGDIRTRGASASAVKRTERDLPMSVVLGGSAAIALAIWAAPILEINALSAVLILLFGFFFVTVSSRITGEIGSSSNPISGMTVATLLITCGLFVAMGWTGVGFKAMALTTAALVCVAASNGGTISQDLKTGFLVGATPRHQQVSILIGVLSSAILIGFTTLFLNQAYTTYRAVQAPEDFRLPTGALSGQRMEGPDHQSYDVAYLHEDAPGVEHGKYLVDSAGRLAYQVDPGVCGTYPYDVQPFTGTARVEPTGGETELGPDHQPYRVVTLATAADGLPAGRYLVRDDGTVAYTALDVRKFDAPKAQLFRLIIDGTLGGLLPWGLVLIGFFLAVIMEMVGVSSLPFAVGLYLPLSTSAGIFVGGVVRWLVDRKHKGQAATEAEFSPGTLMASGLIAGGAIAGVADSAIRIAGKEEAFNLSGVLGALADNHSWWPMGLFLAMAALLYVVGTRKSAA